MTNERLKTARENARMTQSDLAELLGVSRVYVGMVERGRVPSMALASEWCQHVPGVLLEDFVPMRDSRDAAGERHPPE